MLFLILSPLPLFALPTHLVSKFPHSKPVELMIANKSILIPKMPNN